MTVSPHGMPGVQHGQPPGPAAPAPPPLPAPPPGYDWRNQAPPPARRNKGLMAAVAAAIVVATAALVVGIIDLTRPTPTAHPSAPTPTSARPRPPQGTADANRALCQAISPLMAESDKITKAYTSAGGSPTAPERVAATPKFVSDSQDWVDRIQPVLDAHPSVDPFFTRTLQRMIDDRRLLIADLKAGPWQPYDETIYEDSVAAYDGPLNICYDLGVQW